VSDITIITVYYPTLWQILLNLVSNGVKYNKQDIPKIEIQQDQECYTITLSDKGIGIEESKLSIVFELFQRVSITPGRFNNTVTGIGLATVKKTGRKYRRNNCSLFKKPALDKNLCLLLSSKI
jgi:signal transduction histidine kinase